MKDIITLRCVALTSNIAFLIYGVGFGLSPVWLLHTILLPINGWRLCQAVRWDLGTNSEPAVRDPRRATPGTFPSSDKRTLR